MTNPPVFQQERRRPDSNWCQCRDGQREEYESSPIVLAPLRGKGPTSYLVEDRGYKTPCWIWQGTLNSKGYAVRGTQCARHLVHRIVYEQAKGPIPAGEQVHHLCEQHPCVRPDHLEAIGQLAHARLHSGGTAERILAVLTQGPMHFREVASLIDRPPGSVNVALSRGVGYGEFVRVGRGVYALAEQVGRVAA